MRASRGPGPVVAAVLVVGGALAACADYEGVLDPTHGLPDVAVTSPVFSRDVIPIIERRCARGGGHSVLSRQAGLVLTPDSAWAAMVNRPSRLVAGEVRVRPGDGAGSWLSVMIGTDIQHRAGFARMPLGSGPLTANQIATILNWIDRGAAND